MHKKDFEIDEHNSDDDFMAEDEFWQDRFDEAMDGVAEWEEEIERRNTRLLNAIKTVKGELYYEWLLLFLEDMLDGSYNTYSQFQIVKTKPSYATRQTDGDERSTFGKITEYWVHQWSTGMEGDSFSGNLYIQLKENKFLEIPYSC